MLGAAKLEPLDANPCARIATAGRMGVMEGALQAAIAAIVENYYCAARLTTTNWVSGGADGVWVWLWAGRMDDGALQSDFGRKQASTLRTAQHGRLNEQLRPDLFDKPAKHRSVHLAKQSGSICRRAAAGTNTPKLPCRHPDPLHGLADPSHQSQ
jgi:hypothetical protein